MPRVPDMPRQSFVPFFDEKCLFFVPFLQKAEQT
jgi:hypothetical protein